MRKRSLAALCCVVTLLSFHCGSSGDTAFGRPHTVNTDAGKDAAKDGPITDQGVGDTQGNDTVTPPTEGGTGGSSPNECTPGLLQCGNNAVKKCQPNGTWGPEEDCGLKTCSNLLGCVECLPGTGVCEDANTAKKCLNDGSGYYTESCDPDMGSTCDANEGACTGPCAPDNLGKNYIGCEYYATVTMNSLLMAPADFAVAVSNTKAVDAQVKIYKGGVLATQATVGANSLSVIVLPWTALKTTTTTAMFAGQGYHIKSTQPVTVYQFNPLQYNAGGSFTYTNDASLLIPVTAWGTKYMVAARGTWQGYPGFYAVVASQNGTTITATPSATGNSMSAGAGINGDGTGSATLNAGDVLQVASAGGDPTGTIITADKPVEVLGGHNCTFVPSNVGYCDHIEEVMFPMNTLSTEYLVSAPVAPGTGGQAYAFTRVIATEPGITLTYDPPNGGWPASLANTGDFVELNDATAFRVTADKKVLVSQYMQGNGDSSLPADPAMALAVAKAQFRPDYLFHAPTNYDNNYVNITAPTGTAVTLDGQQVSGWVAIGGTGYDVARVELSKADGNHRISASVGFGITVYGYGTDTSYWYPGGLNLLDL